jgi:hypothetical protein
MEHETSSEDVALFAFDIDGQHSDPITPRTAKEMERLRKTREKYIKAGLVQDSVSELHEPGIESK